MPISDQEGTRIVELAKIERLQSDGLQAIADGRIDDANAAADALLNLSGESSDHFVSEMALLAQAGIASGHLAAAATALASVNDQISTATNAFSLAARLAQDGEAKLTFPFIAGKAASLLDLLQSLQKSVTDSSQEIASAKGVDGLLAAFNAARSAVTTLKDKANTLAG